MISPKLTDAVLIPAVGYIRMSTDQQADSPARQKAEILKLAKKEGYKIIAWYEDHGLTGTESANRPEFLKLLNDAKSGAFEAILLYEQSRMSREDVFDAMLHWKILRDAGVRIVTCQRGEMDFNNLGGIITAIVDQYSAREESARLGMRIVSGRLHKIRNGQRLGGSVFGFDREIYDESNELMKTVHYGETFKRPDGWKSKLVPSSDTAAVEALEWAFKAASAGTSPAEIANDFNMRGLKTITGGNFYSAGIRDILKNPVYIGTLRAGHYCRGKFSRMNEEGIIETPNNHAGIIDKKTFDLVQDITKSRSFKKSFQGTYILSGLVECLHCGEKMSGHSSSEDGNRRMNYRCNTIHDNSNADCTHPSVMCKKLESAVFKIVKKNLLTEQNLQHVSDAAKRGAVSEPDCIFDQQLVGIRRDIEKAKRNLALADSSDDFSAVSSVIQDLKKQETGLLAKIKKSQTPSQASPETLQVIAKCLSDFNYEDADPSLLKVALAKCITKITFGRRVIQPLEGFKDGGYPEAFGFIRFSEDVFSGGEIELSLDLLNPDTTHREITNYICSHPERVFTHRELAENFRITHKVVQKHLYKSLASGRVKKNGHNKGWQAISCPSIDV